jgi:hypothetical protein
VDGEDARFQQTFGSFPCFVEVPRHL